MSPTEKAGCVAATYTADHPNQTSEWMDHLLLRNELADMFP